MTMLGDLLKYMKRDERWLSFSVACASLACICFVISSLLYMMIGVPAHTFCLIMMLVGVGLMIPAIMMWRRIGKEEKEAKRKLRQSQSSSTPTPQTGV